MIAMLSLAGMLVAGAIDDRQEPDKTLADFRRFPKETQASMVRMLERKIQLDPNPAIQRIVSMQREHGKLPPAVPAQYHRAAKWAPRVAPERRLLVAGDEQHTAMRKRFPEQTVLRDLKRAVWYDWGAGRIVRRARPLSDREVMHNIFQGYPPGSDDALARLLLKFDTDKKMRKVASYLAHIYADLGANAYEGITLYEAWYSGAEIDVPDVDAIPFAVRILKTRRFRSPIPSGKRRTALYKKIRDRAFAYRKYRTLREAAAAAFLRAEPKMDPMYARLVPRFHYLYVALGDDVDAMAKLLHTTPDRERLIAEVDHRLSGSVAEYRRRDGREKHLTDMSAWLRYWAQLAVYEQNKTDKRNR